MPEVKSQLEIKQNFIIDLINFKQDAELNRTTDSLKDYIFRLIANKKFPTELVNENEVFKIPLNNLRGDTVQKIDSLLSKLQN